MVYTTHAHRNHPHKEIDAWVAIEDVYSYQYTEIQIVYHNLSCIQIKHFTEIVYTNIKSVLKQKYPHEKSVPKGKMCAQIKVLYK